MNTSKQILYKMIEDIPESQIPEVIDFIAYLIYDDKKWKRSCGMYDGERNYGARC